MNYICKDITFGDLFCGGGGVTTGALSIPGVKVLWALNHDEMSIKTHAINHPETVHYQANIRTQNEKVLALVDILWASLECTNYSNAKGGQPRDADSRTLAWELPRYIEHCKPSVIIIENVREFLAWGPLDENGKPVNRQKGEDFKKYVTHIKKMGYKNVDWRILNAADYGCHTLRKRLFVIFSKDVDVKWKEPTHNPAENNLFGKPKWKPVKECINLNEYGNSIFGRKKPLSENTRRRIAGGIKKFYPEMSFLMKYYGNGDNVTSLDEPCHTVTTKDRHALVSVEKKQFITDHVWGEAAQEIDKPLKTQMTRQTKQLITVEKRQFISETYNSNGTPEANNKSINNPAGAVTTREKFQFITAFFNSSGRPETQNQSLEKPLNAVLTSNKYALVSGMDFDIKMRFLTPNELAKITGFPEGYFTNEKINISKKFQVKMIGNAVPVKLSAAVIEPMKEQLEKFKILGNLSAVGIYDTYISMETTAI